MGVDRRPESEVFSDDVLYSRHSISGFDILKSRFAVLLREYNHIFFGQTHCDLPGCTSILR